MLKNLQQEPSYVLSSTIISCKSNITKILTIHKVNIEYSIQSWQTPWNILYYPSNTFTAHVSGSGSGSGWKLMELLNDQGPVPAPNIFISKETHPWYSYTIRNSMRENSVNHRGTIGNKISNDTLAPVNNHTWILKPKSMQFLKAESQSLLK